VWVQLMNILESITNIIYRVIRNDCRSFNNFSYTIHLRQEYFFLFNRTTLQVFVAYLTGAIYVNPLCVESFRSLESIKKRKKKKDSRIVSAMEEFVFVLICTKHDNNNNNNNKVYYNDMAWCKLITSCLG